MPGECKPCADNLKEKLNNFNNSACGEEISENASEKNFEYSDSASVPLKSSVKDSVKVAEQKNAEKQNAKNEEEEKPEKVSEAKKGTGEKTFKQKEEKPVSALPEKPETFKENKISKEEQAEFFKKALSGAQGLNLALIDLYEGFFKNNAAFKRTFDEIEKGLEEYVQAVIISRLIESGKGGELALEFVYKALPRGDLFGGTSSESEAFNVIKKKSREVPMAFLMATAVDVSFKKDYSLKIINGIYGVYCACVSAFGVSPCEKQELTRDLCDFAKKQGVTSITV